MRLYTGKDISKLNAIIPDNSGIFAIIDNKVEEYFSAMKNWKFITVSAKESGKTLAEAGRICTRLMEMGADRDCFIIGAGGGVTTDLAGFVASVYKRGVRFALVPTTLLAAADASIGGKNGVNHLGVKNMIGTITQPEWVFQSPVFFKTLSRRVFREGIAELLKTFLIFDADLYGFAVSFLSGYDYRNPSEKEERLLEKIVRECARLKMEVVRKDEKDRGERMVLNLGHTFGHALESWAAANHRTILHGEAVAAGTIASAKVAANLGLCPKNLADEISEDFRKLGIKTSYGVRFSQIFSAIRQDKKASAKILTLILPLGIGDVVRYVITESDLEKVCSRLVI
ncbi:MAG: 3-dehydroquinate synthase [Bacteroidales bacterium]|nr:3-dehydroquinate synthase [Bacteroidales bacterium]